MHFVLLIFSYVDVDYITKVFYYNSLLYYYSYTIHCSIYAPRKHRILVTSWSIFMSIFLACTYKCVVLVVNSFAASMEFEDAANWTCVVHYRVSGVSQFSIKDVPPPWRCVK